MDPISQGALGAALAAGAARRPQIVAAAGLGFLAGMAADLDILIRSQADPLLFLEYHRQFTHALVFVPVGALVCALALHGFVKRNLRFVETWLYCLLGYATHGVLDACTSYGTQLLWPFSDARIAWNWVSVVDPLFTAPLLACLAGAVWWHRVALARAGLAWAVLYVGLGAVQNARVHDAAEALAAERGHPLERLTVKPSFGNLLLWKSIYLANGVFHVDAIRAGRERAVFQGDAISAFDAARDLPWLDPDSRQARDLERFRWFSDGYVALDSRHGYAVVDIRYSMVPNEIDALWGIRLDPRAGSDAPAAFFFNRRATPEHRSALLDMLLARGI
jgi:inner membrane protein